MAESVQHFLLVQIILRHVRVTHSNLAALALVDDCSKSLYAERPPEIFGSIPDVFGVDTPRTITIIGEAKTDADLLTPRSRAQIAGFYEYLTYQDHGNLIIAVPPAAIGTAKAMINKLSRSFQRSPVNVTVLAG